MHTKQDIREIITHAFQGVSLRGGTSLKQTEVIDRYCEGVTEEEFRALPDTEVTQDWQAISAQELDRAQCIAHLDARGFTYYIPALMVRLLEDYDPSSMRTIGTLRALYPKKDSWEYHMERYSLLSPQQSAAIASYLQALPQLVELDSEDTKVMERALKTYWARFLKQAGDLSRDIN